MGQCSANNLLLIGLSHKTAPIEIREKFSFGTDAIPGIISCLKSREQAGIQECVLLSTCNRTELYAVSPGPGAQVRPAIIDCLLEITHLSGDLREYFHVCEGTQVIEHLFRVVSGIDSMILGEPQIFGQVKNAYALACDYKFTGPVMNRLFHHAFQVGKQVRNITSIGEGVVSYGSAAVALAQKTLGSLRGKSIVLIGAGKIGELCAKQLAGCGARNIFIMNRTFGRAHDLTCRIEGIPVGFECLPEMIRKADIVISSVASQEPVVPASLVESSRAGQDGRPLVIIDLGMPRNVEPQSGEQAGVTVYNIDDLEEVVRDNRTRRLGETARANEIISHEVANYVSWMVEREAVPVIDSLRKKCEEIRLGELERIRNRVDDDTYKVLDRVTRRILRKVLHQPTVRVRSAESEEFRKQLIDSIQELFIKT